MFPCKRQWERAALAVIRGDSFVVIRGFGFIT
jgi:hypothetical protein